MAEWVNSLATHKIVWYILFYFGVQLINVVFNTLKTIITSKGKKIPASIINALTFGFYTLVIYLTAGCGNIWVNMGITVVANLVGVYFSILVLDKIRKDKLWEITATVSRNRARATHIDLLNANISFNANTTISNTANEVVFHIYCPTQKESAKVKNILIKHNAKYIVHEENAKL